MPGAPVRCGPLTWSQQLLWSVYHDVPPSRRHTMNLTRFAELPGGGLATATVREAFNDLVRRYEVLRSTYGIDASGEPVQIVHSPDAAPFHAFEGQGRVAADTLRDRLAGVVLDIEREWPFVGAAMVDGERATVVGLAVHHIAVDGWGLDLLWQRLAYRLGIPVPPDEIEPWQPLDQSAFERSTRGRRIGDRALSYWAAQLAHIPHQMFPITHDRARFTEAVLRCPELPAVVDRLAEDTGTAPAVVALSAFVALLGHYSGHPRTALLTMWANRNTPRTRDAVGCLFQPALLCVDVRADMTFHQLVEETARAHLAATAHAQYPLDEVKELAVRAAAARGVRRFRTGVCFNVLGNDPLEGAPAAARLTGQERPFGWAVGPLDMRDDATDMALLIGPAGDRLGLRLIGRTDILSARQLGQFVIDLRTLLLAAAHHPMHLSELTGIAAVRPLAFGPGWAYVDHCRVNLQQLSAALRSHPSVTAAAVFVDHTCRPATLVAFVATEDATVTPSELTQHIFGTAKRDATTAAPARYVLRARPPPDPASRAQWQAQPPLAPAAPPDRPPTAPQAALLAAVARYHPGLSPSLSTSYVEQGGRLLRVAAIMRELHRAGYSGLSTEDFATPRRLADVASGLHRVPDH